ncbi:MAG TPA: FAD-binding oxidoreductase, partial [Dehalococcoidia bacterium]|nr:FAD-binding oxidoreductase [Dehalococcoidia bacterium]
MAGDRLVDRLVQVVGRDHVLLDPGLKASYERDWTGRYGAEARAVVRPANTSQTAAVLKLCTAADAAVVPQGGNTGLVGGGVPRGGKVLLSLKRLEQIEDFDPQAQQVTAGAGVTPERLNAHAAQAGLAIAVDLASRGSATIGGMVATNAGGIHVIRHGSMRNQVLGVEAVTAAGDVIGQLHGLAKDNSGYSLPALMAGSEGTLAVVTKARLRLVAVPSNRGTALARI